MSSQGGVVTTRPNEDVMDGPPLRRARFQLNLAESSDPLFVAWTDGSRWNGFGCPLFERGEADRFLTYFRMVAADWRHVGLFLGEYNEATDTYCFLQDGPDVVADPDAWDCFTGFDREGRHLYAIGAWCWAWIQFDGEGVS